MFEIRADDLSSEPTRELLKLHFANMHANSPPGSAFVLDLSGLRVPEITVWSAWENGAILGIGALKMLDRSTGEIKSMRTHPDHLRRGVAAALLEHIIAEARRRQLSRLSLETGSGDAFEPALKLYRTRGFSNGAPFGDYQPSEFNQFLHLPL